MNSTTEKKTPSWHVFYTASRQEKKCEISLAVDGHTVFLPLSEQMRQWSDRKKKIKVPLFPGYIFVKILSSEVTKVSGYRGIVGPVRFESGYAIAREEEIESIRRLIETGVYAEIVPGSITIGDKVVVDEGPLKGQTGQCVLESGGNYLYIEIPSVNHSIRCKVPAASLRKI
jgi:transcription antitermination factor NusG